MSDRIIQQFRDAMIRRGIVPPDDLRADGELHRCDAEGKGGKGDAAYVLHLNGIAAGGFINWRDGQDWQNWRADVGRPLSPAEETAYRAKIEATRQAREAESAQRQADAAQKAVRLWAEAAPCTSHPYLTRKGIAANGAKMYRDSLVLPIRDTAGTLHSLQFIAEDGNKRYLSGGRIRGGYFGIGKPKGALCIAEGFATGASIHEATGHAVAVAFDAGNLHAVATALRAKFPDLRLILCADDDYRTEGNPGITKATAAAQAVGGWLAVPNFGDHRPEGATDFNDLHQAQGLDAVARCIAAALEEAAVAPAPAPDVDKAPGNALEHARHLVDAAIAAAAADDCGAVFEDGVIAALRLLRDSNRAEFQRYRTQIKRANRHIRLGELDRAIATSSSEEGRSGTRTDDIITMVRESAQLWHDDNGNGYATFLQDGHYEHWKLDSKGFADWCSYRAYTELGAAPGDSTLKAALVALSGIAKHDGEEHPVGVRVMVADSRYYLDLCNDQWQAVEIDATGWRVLDKPPVRFRRSPSMRPLPTPAPGGDLAVLWPLVNIPVKFRPLVKAVLLDYLRPDTPYPVLVINGSQGSAKSTTHSRCRDLVDPNRVNLRAAPKSTEDIYVSAGANHVVSFENLSHLSDGQQDALCTLATGGGFAARTLYTNTEETVIEVQRPVMLNGIATLATRQDLVDRTVRLELPPVQVRRLAGELAAEFEQQHAAIVGGLLDLFVKTLAKLPTVTVDYPPRMADFAQLGEAMMQAEGSEPGAFLELYRANRERSVLLALESSPVAMALEAYTANWPVNRSATYAMGDWLEELETYRPNSDAWPKAAKGLGDALRRAEPGLRVLGIEVHFGNRSNVGYLVTVRRLFKPLATDADDTADIEEGII